MKRSADRILTTHVGSLARPDNVLELLFAKERSEPYDKTLFETAMRDAVKGIVHQQVNMGIDVVCDGEQSKSSFLTYITDRLSGYATGDQPAEDLWVESRESIAFPEFYEAQRKLRDGLVAKPVKLVCTGPVKYCGDIANVKAAAEGKNLEEIFMTAVSPSDVEGQQPNEFYDSDADYLFAIADAMHEEYQAIVDAGLILQIDDPRLLTYYISRPDLSVDACRRWAELRVEALNHALSGVATERVRFHTCYGINIGPRVHEMNLGDIVDIMLKRQPATRTRVDRLGERQTSRGKDYYSRRHLALNSGRGAPATGRPTSHPFREHSGSRKRIGRQRLRIRVVRRDGTGNSPLDCLGKISEPGRRCKNREQATVVSR